MFSFTRNWSRPKTGRLRNPGCCCCFCCCCCFVIYVIVFIVFVVFVEVVLLLLFVFAVVVGVFVVIFIVIVFFIVVVVCNPEDCCCGQVLNSGSQLAVSRPAPEPPLNTQRNGSQVPVPTHTLHNLAGGFSLLDLKRIFFCPLGPFENYIIR